MTVRLKMLSRHRWRDRGFEGWRLLECLLGRRRLKSTHSGRRSPMMSLGSTAQPFLFQLVRLFASTRTLSSLDRAPTGRMAPSSRTKCLVKGPLRKPQLPPAAMSYTQAPRPKAETDVRPRGAKQGKEK